MDDETREAELGSLIRGIIAREGPISFARFMELALYHTELGYYSASADQIGWEGDYFTSPDLHPLFGRILARQILQMRKILGIETVVVELGAGKGVLSRDLLEGLGSAVGEIPYVIIERGPAMQARQARSLKKEAEAGRVRWTGSIEEAGTPGRLVACVFSNEFFDALPVHRVVGREGGVREILVDFHGGEWRETEREPSEGIEEHLERLHVRLAEGQQAEVHLEADRWMRRIGAALGRGFVLTIDYGFPAQKLYAPWRRRGTLLCYHRHRANEDPYRNLGRQDITAHVDFTSLALAGREAGLEVTGFTSQAAFLLGLGAAQAFETELADLPESERQAVLNRLKPMLDPGGMGGVFKVLIQHRGVDPLPLDGLRFSAYPKAVLALS